MSYEIIIRVPKWAADKPITVLAGREVIARRINIMNSETRELSLGPLEHKDIRCNFCGYCCRNITGDWIHGTDEEDTCLKLEYQEMKLPDGTLLKGWMCTAYPAPFSCVVGKDPDDVKCIIRYKEV